VFIESAVLPVREEQEMLIGEGRRQLMKSVMKDAEQKRSLEESKAASKGRGKAESSLERFGLLPQQF
jgi:hypothetical protein